MDWQEEETSSLTRVLEAADGLIECTFTTLKNLWGRLESYHSISARSFWRRCIAHLAESTRADISALHTRTITEAVRRRRLEK